MNILIVDDQKFVREAIKADLVESTFEYDFQMFEAEDANQGIETIVATEGNIDLLILDLKMNNSDGMEVINFLSVHACYSNIPLAVISSSDKRTLGLVGSIVSSLKLNLVGVFEKPINVGFILAQVTRLQNQYGNEIRVKPPESVPGYDIDKLLEDEQILLCFQPQVDIKSKCIIGFEVLARMYDENGYIYPDTFLPLIDKAGLNVDFTKIIITKAFKFWAHEKMLSAYTLSINVTAEDLISDNLIDYIIRHKQAHADIKLILELTESQEIINQASVLNAIARLIINDISISLDDFGKSYSTYERLDTIPFNEIKIDRSFVCDIDTNEQHHLIVESTIALAKKMSVSVVAEGIETESVLNILAELGCDIAQGYLYSPPIEGRYLKAWVHRYVHKDTAINEH
ncbi:diguanylate cyclase/phosphodiesterase (GGDEF & EAL domains) with PAS/PAC sensor(s) [Moritella sp. JT01]|uniref:EAL domain-containing response regulator n=1 Tax=Moritella sp. JT01 TaxID=756698 RepID=UPI000799DDCC|nr:EAL domain-containing response regulator [Moritella sp. JT01]KXO09487.1 diguanylate cyclase/phosphodiesterase (GGDEF & EAL domains) with PAS/PAC sensor(s) [Moritella sp. JT01]